jgi:lysophospholipase L1-like esterase
MQRIAVSRDLQSRSMLGVSLVCAIALSCSDGGESTADSGATAAPVAGQAGAAGAAGATGTAGTIAPPNPMAGAGGTGGSAGQSPQPTGGGGAGGSPEPMTAGGTGGGAPDAGVDAAMPTPDHVSPCIDDPNDVVLMGDSYVDWITHTFVADIRAESGQQWPSYAVGATSMATGGVGRIPDQLGMALADNPEIKAIIMTGGGNDILVADTVMFPDAAMCTRTPDAPMIEDCRTIIQLALDKAAMLMDETADAGVRDVVYFFYPHIPGGGLVSGMHPNAILDYALPRAREVCESSLERTAGRMKCHFIDMVPVFEGKPGLFADALSEAGDGIHPNSMGSKLMAEEVWRVMKQDCVGQPASSGCCAAP